MTGTQLAALIHQMTRTDSTTFSLANMLVLVNIKKDDIAIKIAAARNEAFNVEDTDDLADDTRTYIFDPSVMSNLVRLELKFASTSDYVLATSVKQSQVRIALQESIIINYYDNLDPAYFVRGKYIYILSGTIVDVTGGIKWVYKKFPTDLANLTGSAELSTWTSATAPGMPKEFHELWAMAVSIAYKDINNIRLSSEEQKHDRKLAKAIANFAIPNIDEQIVGKLPATKTDNGYDL